MVIFHSYVKLPEGKMNRKNIQDVSQILKMSEVALCWAPPMAQRLRSARNFCTPRRWWKTCRRRWLLWFKSWSFQNTSMYVQCIFKSFQCMFRIFQCMFRIFQCIFRSCFKREHVVPMVTYGESRADGGRIVLTHVVFPLTGVLPISLPMTRCKCWKSYRARVTVGKSRAAAVLPLCQGWIFDNSTRTRNTATPLGLIFGWKMDRLKNIGLPWCFSSPSLKALNAIQLSNTILIHSCPICWNSSKLCLRVAPHSTAIVCWGVAHAICHSQQGLGFSCAIPWRPGLQLLPWRCHWQRPKSASFPAWIPIYMETYRNLQAAGGPAGSAIMLPFAKRCA